MKKVLMAIGMALLCAVLLLAFYLAVIMGNPQEDNAPDAPIEQPLLPAMSSPLLIRDQSQLGLMMQSFPAPLMAAVSTPSLVFTQGLCQDVPFEEGLARTVTLSYQAEGGSVTVTSIYPARALALVDRDGYSFSDTASPTLAGLRAVRMDGSATVRLHAQGDEAIYVVTLPKAYANLRDVTAALQLYQGE